MDPGFTLPSFCHRKATCKLGQNLPEQIEFLGRLKFSYIFFSTALFVCLFVCLFSSLVIHLSIRLCLSLEAITMSQFLQVMHEFNNAS